VESEITEPFRDTSLENTSGFVVGNLPFIEERPQRGDVGVSNNSLLLYIPHRSPSCYVFRQYPLRLQDEQQCSPRSSSSTSTSTWWKILTHSGLIRECLSRILDDGHLTRDYLRR